MVGRKAHIVENTGRKVSVSGFTDELGKPLLVDVVHALIAYDCNLTGKSFLLLINNALSIPSLDCCLINPFIMRLAGLHVDECPKFLSPIPSAVNHSIYLPEYHLRIPLKLDGIISYIPCRSPHSDEAMDVDSFVSITPRHDTWDPHVMTYSQQEESMMNYQGEVKQPAPRKFIVSSVLSRSDDPSLFAYDLVKSVSDNPLSCHQVCSIKSFDGGTSGLDPIQLARTWNIGLETAKRAIQRTTRLCPRNTTSISLNRRYAANDRMIRYKHLNCVLFSDTMFASSRVGKSVRYFTCCQVFSSDFGWTVAYNIEFERDIHHAYKRLFKEVGVPMKMIVDGARAQVMGEARKICEMAGCEIVELEKDTPASNRAERGIQELKMETKRDMKISGSPLVFWCYCIERRAEIMACTARNNPNLNGLVPRSMMTGEVTDISHLCNFQWYEWVKFRQVGPDAAYPYPSEHLGRCLGPAKNKGNAMSQHVLLSNGKVIPIQTLRSLTPAEVDSDLEKAKREEFDNNIRRLYGDSNSVPPNWVKRRKKDDDGVQYIDDLDADINKDLVSPSFGNEDELGQKTHSIPQVDDVPDFDAYVHAEVLLPKNGEVMQAATVLGQSTDLDGNPIGEYDSNPMLNTRVYDVMFPDGDVQQYSANIIAQNIYDSDDDDGYRYQHLDDIIGHRKLPNAVPKSDGHVTSKNGERKPRKTSKGWNIHVRWKDGLCSWVPMVDVKESCPVELAEYAVANKIDSEPAFAWWVPYTLKKRDHIISAVKNRVKKRSHKYGIEVPRTVEEAYMLDRKNNNTLWRDAVKKEMENVMVAFKILDTGENLPVGFSKLGVHMVFDIKLDLTRKARLVADGHLTPDPGISPHSINICCFVRN